MGKGPGASPPDIVAIIASFLRHAYLGQRRAIEQLDSGLGVGFLHKLQPSLAEVFLPVLALLESPRPDLRVLGGQVDSVDLAEALEYGPYRAGFHCGKVNPVSKGV